MASAPVILTEEDNMEQQASERVRPPVAQPKVRGRPKAKSKPKIDLDEEIAEANRLAEISRRMLGAAKTIQRNNRRSKQRLMRKAGKLSPEDLERIAVLKRCGLYAQNEDEASDEEARATPAPKMEPARAKKLKLASSIQKIRGAEGIFEEYSEIFQSGAGHGSSSSASSSSSSAAVTPEGTTHQRAPEPAPPAEARGSIGATESDNEEE